MGRVEGARTCSNVSMCRYTPAFPRLLLHTSFPSILISNTSSSRVELTCSAATAQLQVLFFSFPTYDK